MAEFVIPAALIEAAAIALHANDVECGDARRDETEWAHVPPSIQANYRRAGRAALAAALGVCQVREERVCQHGLTMPGSYHSSRVDCSPMQRRLVITTPAEEVPTDG